MIENTLESLLLKLETYLSAEEVSTVSRAYAAAEKAHEGQFRESSVAYIQHPLAVAHILTDLKQDVATVSAGLLHDCIEDTPYKEQDLTRDFGAEITRLVMGTSKIDKLTFSSKEEAQAENYRKMLLAIAKDLRVVVIKLADRLHNMRTLKHMREDKQKRIAQETFDIFAPLAHRFGMANIKWELEDLSFYYLQYDDFQKIKSFVSGKRAEREEYLEQFKITVADILKKQQILCEISGRPKHFFSIYKKMKEQSLDFTELFDTLGIRVLVEQERHCYEVLGLIHAAFSPVSGRFKDYIAMPKPNMYQSLHTTIFGPEGRMIEAQIRTFKMHDIAERGVAAHWRYKEGKTDQKYEDQFSWLKDLLQDTVAPKEFLTQLKSDLFSDEVFVYTPTGDVKILPQGATSLDFAYAIHTQVGHCCTGAKVNGAIVTLDYVLQNEDHVSILTSKKENPKLDWLHFVKTHQARTKIKNWFKKLTQSDVAEKGREKLEKSLLPSGISLLSLEKTEPKALFHKFSVEDWQGIYLKLAEGDLSIRELSTSISEILKQQNPEFNPIEVGSISSPKKKGGAIAVMGDSHIQSTLAKCCMPIFGDDILGIVTIGKGISVHRSDCKVIAPAIESKKDRFFSVQWVNANQHHVFSVDVQIEAFDRIGILQEILRRISDLKINMTSVKTKSYPNQSKMRAKMTVEVQNIEQLGYLKQNLTSISDVISVQRC